MGKRGIRMSWRRRRYHFVGGVVDVLAGGLEGGVEFGHSGVDGGDVLHFVGVFQLSEGGLSLMDESRVLDGWWVVMGLIHKES
jgi:hypothetical protein